MVLKLKWWLLFYNTLLSCFCVSFAGDVSEIKLTLLMFRGKLICDAPPLVNIEVGKQFRIVVDPGKTDFHNIKMCRKSLESNESVNTQFWKDPPGVRYGYSSNEFNANTPGDWDYECVFFTERCTSISSTNKCRFSLFRDDGFPRTIDGIKCLTKVHVYNHGEIVPFYLSANSENFTRTNKEHMYMFYDGEGANFTCHTTTGGRVRLTHTTSAGKWTSAGIQAESVNMYMKLRAANNNDTIECVLYDENSPLHMQVISLTLNVPKETRGILAIVVNGLILPRTKQTADTYYFEYMYYDGESLTVALIKDQDMYGEFYMATKLRKKIKHYFKNESTQINYIRFNLDKKETNTQIYFIVFRKTDLIRKELFHIVVTFIFHAINYGPYISGLSMSNVLLQYSNATSNIIEYNIGNETLHLYCNAHHNDDTNFSSTGTWHYSFGEVFTPHETMILRPFQLRPDKNNAIIHCIDNSNKTTFLKLIREKDGGKKVALVTGATTTTERTNQITSPTVSEGSSKWIVVLATVLSLGCAITITALIIRRCRKQSVTGEHPGASSAGNWESANDSGLPEMDHAYEAIDDILYVNPYAVSAPVLPPRNEPPRDISQRAPVPLPVEQPEDNNGKYIHYDTPYDFRIFQRGIPTERCKDLFVTSRGRLRSNCHPPRGARRY